MYSNLEENQPISDKKSTFLQTCNNLFDLGFHVMPLKGDDYSPALSRWQKLVDGGGDSGLFKIWSKNKYTGVGIVCGSTVIDRDIIVGLDLSGATPDELVALSASLPESNMVARGENGNIMFYQADVSFSSAAYTINGRVVARILSKGDFAPVPGTPGLDWFSGPIENDKLAKIESQHVEALNAALRELGATRNKVPDAAGVNALQSNSGAPGGYSDDFEDEESNVSTELPDRLTRLPGLVGRVTDWIVSTSRNPNRVLALGVALTLIGTLCGRRDAGPTKTGLSLYTVLLGPSGVGKQHGLNQGYRLLKAAGAMGLMGKGEFGSAPAVAALLCSHTLSLSLQDEFGTFLQRILGKKSSSFERNIAKDLRSAWGANYGLMQTTDFVNKPGKTVHAPALSIYGVSTPQEFYSALGGADLENGTLNRFLVMSTSKPPIEIEPALDDSIVPDDIADDLFFMFRHERTITSNRSATEIPELPSYEAEITPRIIPWKDDAAKDVYESLKDSVKAIRDESPLHDNLYARTAEMALRIATIIALGQDWESPAVSVLDIETGRDIAMHSARRMAAEAGNRMRPDTVDAMWLKVEERIRREGGSIRYSKLFNFLKMKAREVEELLRGMEAGNRILTVQERPKTGGKPIKTIVLTRRQKRA